MAGMIEGELAHRLLEHAAQCAFCGKELRYARDAIEGGQAEPSRGLLTASKAWQKKFAERIAAGEIDKTDDKPDRKPD